MADVWNWSMVHSGWYGGEYRRLRVIENRYADSMVIKVVDLGDDDSGPVIAEFECMNENKCRNVFMDWLRSWDGGSV